MSRFLKGLGVFLAALGLIGAVLVVREIPFRNYRIAKQDLAASSLNADAAATLAAVYLAIGVAAGIGLGGAATGAILLGLGSVMDRLDLLTGQTSRRADATRADRDLPVLRGTAERPGGQAALRLREVRRAGHPRLGTARSRSMSRRSLTALAGTGNVPVPAQLFPLRQPVQIDLGLRAGRQPLSRPGVVSSAAATLGAAQGVFPPLGGGDERLGHVEDSRIAGVIALLGDALDGAAGEAELLGGFSGAPQDVAWCVGHRADRAPSCSDQSQPARIVRRICACGATVEGGQMCTFHRCFCRKRLRLRSARMPRPGGLSGSRCPRE